MHQNLHQIDLAPYGITVEAIHRNLSPAHLYEHAIRYETGSSIADSGALIALSGGKTLTRKRTCGGDR
jgi:phosphoenolpyruvate carboxykinase (ATP)